MKQELTDAIAALDDKDDKKEIAPPRKTRRGRGR
jgi:hypothetical protein